MSTSTAAFATPDSVTVQPDEKDALWTSDSERGLTAQPDATPEPVEVPSEETSATTEPAEVETTEADPSDKTADKSAAPERDEKGQFIKGKGKPRSDPRARVEAATAKEAAAKEEARQAREEAARLKAEIEALKRPAPTPPPPAAAPVSGRFPAFEVWAKAHPGQDFDDYTDARAAHVARQEWAKADQEKALQSRVSTYQTRMDTAAAADPELKAALAAPRTAVDDALAARGFSRFPDAVIQAVVESERAPDITKYFLAHPQDAAQLAVETKDLPVTAASLVRRSLEALLPAAAAARPDSAPEVRPSARTAPINRVGGSATATPVDPDDLPFGPEYIRKENDRERKAREAGRW